MPYKVLVDCVSLLKVVGEHRDPKGVLIGYDNESVLRLKDEIVPDKEISPIVLKLYEANDVHTRSVIVKCDDKGNPVDDVPEPAEEAEPEGLEIVSKTGTGRVTVAAKES